ncbi:hypothetical protein TYRP_021095 [Tyrophagus putrescentiae]|nr:hypothetical protein TYRP_021095 [Tyrophagus putrescentiae]
MKQHNNVLRTEDVRARATISGQAVETNRRGASIVASAVGHFGGRSLLCALSFELEVTSSSRCQP